MATEYTHELRLLAAAVYAANTGSAIDARAAAAALDARSAAALAHRHGVAPLVARGLTASGADLPSTFTNAIGLGRRDNAEAALRACGQLAALGSAFDGDGVAWRALKGPALSLRLYSDPGVRQVGDLDVLVPPESLLPADARLIALGYKRVAPTFALDENRLRAYDWKCCHASYVHPEHAAPVELHWRLHPNAALMDSSFDAFADRDYVRLGGQRIPVLPPAADWLYLAVHGARHGWYRLMWLADLHRLTLIHGPAVFAEAQRLAHTLGLSDVFSDAHLLADHWFTGYAAGGAAERRFAPWRGPGSGQRPSGWALLRTQWQLRRESGYRWRLLRAQLVDLRDIERWSVPNGWYFLYLLARPLSWVARKLRRL